MSTFGAVGKLAKAVIGRLRGKSGRRAGARRSGNYNARRRRGGGPNGVVTKKFTTLEDPIDVATGAFSPGVESFELADMPQFSNYIALYEQFKITKIVYHFRSQGVVQVAAGSLGYLHTVVDHNDITLPVGSLAGIQTMMNDTGYKGCSANRDLTRVIRPMYLTQAGTQTAKSTRGWLNCRDNTNAVNAVSHFGIKWIVQGGRGNSTANYQPVITYYIQFKNPQ